MSIGTIEIARRFCGPPESANGGYACGRLAAFVDGPAEVSLWKPPPLDRPLQLKRDAERVDLYDGETLIASAAPGAVRDPNMVAPLLDDAAAAAERTFDASRHPLPTCFVCGPQRRHGDGLRIHPGPLDPGDTGWNGLLAAPWVPHADFADAAGIVLPEFVWAALDCPTAYAASSPDGMLPILLGRQSVEILRLPEAGEPCIVTAKKFSQAGRKYHADACLFDAAGTLLARGNALWIGVSPEVQRGDLRM